MTEDKSLIVTLEILAEMAEKFPTVKLDLSLRVNEPPGRSYYADRPSETFYLLTTGGNRYGDKAIGLFKAAYPPKLYAHPLLGRYLRELGYVGANPRSIARMWGEVLEVAQKHTPDERFELNRQEQERLEAVGRKRAREALRSEAARLMTALQDKGEVAGLEGIYRDSCYNIVRILVENLDRMGDGASTPAQVAAAASGH